MGFASFFGRVMFSSVFILSACLMLNDFGTDDGSSVKIFEPKYNRFKRHVTKCIGVQLPEIEIKHLVAAAIALKGIGSLRFIFGSSFGACLLNLALFGALVFFLGMKNSSPKKPKKKTTKTKTN